MAHPASPAASRHVTVPTLAPLNEDMSKQISALTAENIQSLATKIANYLMDEFLKIDVPPEKVTGIATFPDGREGYMLAQITPPETAKRKTFVDTLIPMLSKELTEAFSIPAAFCEKGLVFDLYNTQGSGLINQMKTRIFDSDGVNLLAGYSGVSQMSCIAALFTLKFYQDEQYGLRFSLEGSYSNRSWSLKEFTKL